jgi:hypothetical protein
MISYLGHQIIFKVHLTFFLGILSFEEEVVHVFTSGHRAIEISFISHKNVRVVLSLNVSEVQIIARL